VQPSERADLGEASDEDRHRAAPEEEWVFAAWAPDGSVGVISAHRIVGRTIWYWSAIARADQPLLHITDFDVRLRADPFVVKGEALWAEHRCEARFEQWTLGNETYAAALEHPDDALGSAHGTPTAVALDLEWYAVSAIEDVPGTECAGYRQRGVVHGLVEILGAPSRELVEVPALRWHRWTTDPAHGLAPLHLPIAAAHTGIGAPFRFPDGTVLDLVLTAAGWGTRRRDR
jgi:hypothetical protein